MNQMNDLETIISTLADFYFEDNKAEIDATKNQSNIKDGKKNLYDEDFELLLLDLVLPRDSDSEPILKD